MKVRSESDSSSLRGLISAAVLAVLLLNLLLVLPVSQVRAESEGQTTICQSCSTDTNQCYSLTRSVLWTYAQGDAEENRTASFDYVTIDNGNVSQQFYELTYSAYLEEHILELSTRILLLDAETYKVAFSFVNSRPVQGIEVNSLDGIVFNFSGSLSEHYVLVSDAAKEFGKRYEQSGNTTLMKLANSYYAIREEAIFLSNLVARLLPSYDRDIPLSSAILMDLYPCEICPCEVVDSKGNTIDACGGGGEPPNTCTLECWLDQFLTCFGYIDYVMAAAIFGCALAAVSCVWAGGPAGWAVCFGACMTTAGYVELIGTAACAFVALFGCCL